MFEGRQSTNEMYAPGEKIEMLLFQSPSSHNFHPLSFIVLIEPIEESIFVVWDRFTALHRSSESLLICTGRCQSISSVGKRPWQTLSRKRYQVVGGLVLAARGLALMRFIFTN